MLMIRLSHKIRIIIESRQFFLDDKNYFKVQIFIYLERIELAFVFFWIQILKKYQFCAESKIDSKIAKS